jgi:hypothetical protein
VGDRHHNGANPTAEIKAKWAVYLTGLVSAPAQQSNISDKSDEISRQLLIGTRFSD